MKEFIIVWFNNSLGRMFNKVYKDCSKKEAIQKFNNDYPKTNVLVNIIEI